MGQEKKTVALKGVDAALLSHLAYVDPAGLRQIQQGIKPNEPLAFARAGISTRGEKGDVPHLTSNQAAYLNKNFELLDVKDFGDDIHAVTVRDKRSGEVTIAFPGTNPTELSDLGRAISIGHNGTMQVTKAAEEYVRSIAEQHGAVHLTGHSAGGTLAMRLTDRLDDKVVARATVFQAPGETRIERIGKGHPRRQETERVHSTDDPRVVSYQADGDFIGGIWTDPVRAQVLDVSQAGAEFGALENHSKKNMTNTTIDQAVEGLRGLAAEAGISDPTLDEALDEIQGLTFPTRRRYLTGPERQAARRGIRPTTQGGGQDKAAVPLSATQSAIPGPQSRAGAWDKGQMTRLVQNMEGGQPPLNQMAEKNPVSDMSAGPGQTESTLGSFVALNRRRGKGRGLPDLGLLDSFDIAPRDRGAAASGNKTTGEETRASFDPDAFLRTPLERLDETEVRRAMTQPAYYQSWRPFSREMNDHVTNWFRQVYPG